MKLNHVMGARLTLDSDEQITLERIGKGVVGKRITYKQLTAEVSA